MTFAYFYQGAFDNINTRLDMAISIVHWRSLEIDNLAFNTIDKAEYNGHFYAEKAPGTSLLALLPTLIFKSFGSLDEVTKAENQAAQLLCWVTWITIALPSALSSIFFMRSLRILNPNQSVITSALMTLLTYTGTLLLPYSTVLFGHGLAGSLFAILAYLTLRIIDKGSATTKLLFAIGVVIALIAIVEFPCVVPAAFFAIYVLGRQGRLALSRLPVLISPALVTAGILAFINNISFGSPFRIGYGALSQTPFASEMSKGFFGLTFPDTNAMMQLLFGQYRGLFFYAPILLFSVYGLSRLKIRSFALLLAAAAGALWLINSSYAYWQGGVCFGPRHLVPVIPLLSLGLAAFGKNEFDRKFFLVAFIPAAALSLVINLLGTAIGLFVTENDFSPLTQSYWDLARQNLVSINPRGFLTAMPDVGFRWANFSDYPNTSWNLGELLGFKGLWSLLPLLVCWGLGVIVMTRFARGDHPKI